MDLPLEDGLAERLIGTQFPSLGSIRVSARHGGVDHHAVEINDTWIFRFPKRAECEAMLSRELRLLPELASFMPVQVPEYEFIGAPSHEFPCLFAGYRKLPGTPAIECAPGVVDLQAVGRDLGPILSALQAVPLDFAALIGVVNLEDFESADGLRTGTLEELAAIQSVVPASTRARCRAFVDGECAALAAAPRSRCLLHGDLSAEHLLIDPTEGQVVGLIDWADACFGDPAYDLKFLWAWLGEEAVLPLITPRQIRMDVGLLDRVRYYGVCTAVGEVAYGLATGREDNLALGLAALQRQFGDDRPAS